jgi:hypothetical protein
MLGGVQAFFTPLKDSFTGDCTEETTILDVFMFIFFGKGQKHSLPSQF